MQANPVTEALSSVTLGAEVVVDNLTMVPLFRKWSDAMSSVVDYVVLDDALASGGVEITEVSEQGSVPDLAVLNRGRNPVLIVDGEELLGAKQNRIINLTVLVPAQTSLTIPVSCVEAGRWRSRSRGFTSAPRTQFASGRAKRMASVSYSMRAGGERMSDQAQVWDDIAEKSRRLNAQSPTSAMDAIFSLNAASIERYVDACRPVDHQVGALFVVKGRVVGFDLFDQPSTLRRLLPKLVRSAAVDAIDRDFGEPPGRRITFTPLAYRSMLAVVADSEQHVTPALGLGEDVRLSAPAFTGAALQFGGHAVHVSAFAL